MREVIAGKLWIGSAGDARDIRGTLDHGIKAVVDVAFEEPPVVYPRDMTYCRFPLVDGPGNPEVRLRTAVRTASALIEAGTPTLIACGGGMSRAPSVAAAALAHATGIDLQQALGEVLGDGPRDVAPGFWASVQAAAVSER